MYEMAFSVQANGQELMEVLDLTGHSFVVDISDRAEMSALFETSYRKEMFKNPLYDVAWCANIINIIRIYAEARRRQSGTDGNAFQSVLEYMARHMTGSIRMEELSAIAYMQPTYFIRRFRQCFGLPPMAYLNRMRMYKAMGLLAGTSLSIEQIAAEVGIQDASYFARVFRKHCGVTPSEYRARFGQSAAPHSSTAPPLR